MASPVSHVCIPLRHRDYGWRRHLLCHTSPAASITLFPYFCFFRLCRSAYPPTTLIFVGSSRFQSIPMGSGGIHRITGFLNGKTASRGPVQYVCQCADRTCGRGLACEPGATSSAGQPGSVCRRALKLRIASEIRTPTSHTLGSSGVRTPPENVLRFCGCSISGISGSSLHR